MKHISKVALFVGTVVAIVPIISSSPNAGALTGRIDQLVNTDPMNENIVRVQDVGEIIGDVIEGNIRRNIRRNLDLDDDDDFDDDDDDRIIIDLDDDFDDD